MTVIPPDYATPVGQVRLLIADVSTLAADRLFTDEQVEAFLAINGDNLRRAAADALDAIATSEVLVSKKIRTQDLTTDGPAVAAELRARAKQLREQADRDDEPDIFDVVYDEPDDSTCITVWGL